MIRAAAVVALALFAAGCMRRTQIAVVNPKKQTEVYVGDKSGLVYDFETATDVPDGSENLGWVEVPIAADDEATYVALRQKICEMGGNALSQAAWVKEVSEDTPRLKANAWALP